MKFESIRHIIAHGEAYLFGFLSVFYIWRTFFPFYNPLFNKWTDAFGIISPGSPHQLSFLFVFMFGLYLIRPPFFQVNTSRELLIKIAVSIFALGLATTTVEGSWDIIYAYKYYFSTDPALVAGVSGGIAFMAEVILICWIMNRLKIFNPFNWKRIFTTFILLYIYYFIWYFGLGFDTSGAPNFSHSLITALTEIGHWGLGIGGFAWSLKKKDYQ